MSKKAVKSLADLGATLATAGSTFHLIDAVVIGAGTAAVSADELMVSDLLADLERIDTPADEILEVGDSVTGDELTVLEINANAIVPEDELDAALEVANAAASKQALYAAQSGTANVNAGDKPATDVAAVDPAADKVAKAAAKEAAKAAKKAAAATAKAEKDAAKAAAKAAKPAPVTRATSITHKPGALLMAKLGTTARDTLVFSMSDAATLDTADLHAKQDAFVERMNDNDAIADKVKEKMTMLLCWLQKGGELNEVMKRALTVLHEKGELTSGDKGNLQINLLSKPYSMGTARSQANQMFMAFPELGICSKEKGRMVANPDSVLLPMALSKLGLV